MDDVVLDGIRGIDDPVAIRIGVGTMTFVLHHAPERRTSPALNECEAFVLSRVDGETAIMDLVSASPMSEDDTLRSVSALLAIGMLEARPPAPPAG